LQYSKSPANLDPRPQKPTVFTLVAGALKNRKDLMMAGDFSGIFKALQEHNIGGHFYTNYDIFDIVLESNLPIKCEREGISKIAVSVSEAQTGIRWYDVSRSPQDFRNHILAWIASTWPKAAPGDAVNVFLVGHGRSDGSFHCGPNASILPIDMARACRSFAQGVQVNVISNACYSGGFVDQFLFERQKNRFVHTAALRHEKAYGIRTASGSIRNTKFGGAYVEQLPKLLCLGTHLLLIKNRVEQHGGPAYKHTPQTFQADVSTTDLIEDILFREYVSIAYDPTENRRLLSPPQGSGFLAGLSLPPVLKAQAAAVILDEYHRMDSQVPEIEDSWFVVAIERGIRDPGELVGSLYLRGVFQLELLEAFLHLAGRGLLSFDALQEAIDYARISEVRVSMIEALLQAFPRLRETTDSIGTTKPLEWFAVMVIRSADSIRDVFAALHQTGYFGPPGLRVLGRDPNTGAPLRLYANPGEGVCDTVQNRSFGLYLPEKVENPETITIVSAFMKRWLPINEIGKNLMALSKEPLKNQYLSQ
jgi:hypothetical protein